MKTNVRLVAVLVAGVMAAGLAAGCGSDAKSGTKIYELKFAGKTGWMNKWSKRL